MTGVQTCALPISFTIDIPKLPAGLVVKSVSVTSQGIVAAATASNTTFTELSPGGTATVAPGLARDVQ